MEGVRDMIARFPHAVLFTHPRSPTHLRLYEACGFNVGMLTAVMSGPTCAGRQPAHRPDVDDSRRISQAVFDGLDLTREIVGLEAQKLGVVVGTDDGFAVCHFGPDSEARDGALYVKFAAARDGKSFAPLLDAIEGEAARLGATRIALGVNSARRAAYSALLARGYRVQMWGVNMHRPDDPGWDRPDCFVIDDLK
jgi:hypothetical protein